MSRTLADLDLVPNAMLEVRLTGGGGEASAAAGGGVVAAGDGGLVAQITALLVWILSLLNPAYWLGGGTPTGTSPAPHRVEAPTPDPSDAGSTSGARMQPSHPARRGPAGTPMAGGGRHVTLAQLGDPDDKDTNERFNGDSTSLM